MPARKRGFDEVDSSVVQAAPPPSLLHKIRNCWQFAALMQYIFFFGQAVKIDQNLDVDELEAECLKPNSEKLSEIGLALLKYVSSHKGLTPDIFDEYTRRQYHAKAPQRNPFGEEEEPLRFVDFDIFTKLKVLYQLSTWTLNNPDRIRAQMEEKESEQTQWRIEPLGWDRDERSYFVLDDDRLYRRTEPPPPPEPAPKPKAKAKPKARRGRRQSKRIKVAHEEEIEVEASEVDGEETEVKEEEEKPVIEEEEDGLGGAKWECIAITYEEYKAFLDTIHKSRDGDEKTLYNRLNSDVLPIIEKRAEAQARKVAARQRELENLEEMANAKRSSRIAGRVEQQKQIQEAEEAERKRKADLEMAKKKQEKQQKLEEARESRMMTREQRLKDREVKRILHEEELARLREGSEQSEASQGRTSERHRQQEMERRERAIQELKAEDESDDWYFDCAVCGMHGKNFDDGTHSISCEKCNVWQHTACHGVTPEQAEKDDFHFVCASCRKTGLKLRLQPSTSPEDRPKPVVHINGGPQQSAGPTMSNGHHANGYSQQPQTHPLNPQQSPTPMSAPGSVTNGHPHVNGMPAQQTKFIPYQPQFAPSPQHSFAKPVASMTSFPPSHGSASRTSFPPPQAPSPNQHPSAFTSPAPRAPPVPPMTTPYQAHQRSIHHAMTPHTTFALSGNSVAATPATSFHSQFQQTPASASRPALAAASFANSPTPSLSATQGATDFHFSPAPVHQPRLSETPNVHTSNNNVDNSNASDEPFFSPEGASFVSASAYIPATSAPTAAALSPIKHDPPSRSESPMLPTLPIPSVEGGGGSASVSPRPPTSQGQGHRQSGVGLPEDVPVPNLRSSPEIDERVAGMSPTKHDLPPSSPLMADADAEVEVEGEVEAEAGMRGDISMLDVV